MKIEAITVRTFITSFSRYELSEWKASNTALRSSRSKTSVSLTFLTGLYGMNFDHMPELHWAFSYYGLLVVMGVMVLGQVIYFRKRNWL